MSNNPDARPEPMTSVDFEGTSVHLFKGKLPALVMDMPEGFQRGTHLKVQLEMRVRNVGYVESTDKGTRGELVRNHDFVLEESGGVTLIGSMSADEADPGVGGGLASQLEERMDIGDVVRDCWYDASDLTLDHRGGCDICHREVSPEVQMETVRRSMGPGVDPEVGF